MSSRRHLFLFGFRNTLPFQTGVIPFGILYATVASSIGFPWWLTMFLSLVVFAGSSQLVFMDLLQNLGSPFQAVLGSNIVNARHLIYSASMSQQWAHFSPKWKLVLSYLLTDQLFAFSQLPQFKNQKISEALLPWIYLGSGVCTWVFWLLSCAVGGTIGKWIPSDWNLSFSIPLMFLPLLFSGKADRYSLMACVLSIAFAFLFQSLPLGTGVFLAIIVACLIAFAIERMTKK